MIATTGITLTVNCGGVGEKVVKNVNPCGTILVCDPAEYDLLVNDFPDWELDPTCTIPGQCNGVWPIGTGTATTP